MSFLSFTGYQMKRFLLYNTITMPISTTIYLPYNLFVLGFSGYQIKVWILTGVLYGILVAFIMTWISIYATHFVDRHVKK